MNRNERSFPSWLHFLLDEPSCATHTSKKKAAQYLILDLLMTSTSTNRLEGEAKAKPNYILHERHWPISSKRFFEALCPILLQPVPVGDGSILLAPCCRTEVQHHSAGPCRMMPFNHHCFLPMDDSFFVYLQRGPDKLRRASVPFDLSPVHRPVQGQYRSESTPGTLGSLQSW